MRDKPTLLSLFDGSGGFSLAASMCGIEPAYASEVEPYPIAVTRSRFPNMIHLGDVSKINGARIKPCDVVSFGSPCQDMSIAGKREGIKHEVNGDEETTRSGLFMEAARIIKEMREATNGVYPAFAVWENVPGAFSSNKGEDFKIVLQTLIQIVEPTAVVPDVPKAGWSYYDCWLGDGWSIAYRTFDAQYWGVPQRRRRIYLALDLRGQRAGKVLFERESLSGYFAQSGAERQGIAAGSERSIGADCAECYDTRGNGDGKTASTITGDHENRVTDYTTLCCYPINDKATRWQGGGETRNHDGSGNGLGVGKDGEPSPTLTAGDRHAVCTAYGFKGKAGAQARGIAFELEKSPTLTSQLTTEVLIARVRGFGDYIEDEKGSTLKARDHKDTSDLVIYTKPKYIVRRLTPTECCRLQGFPDGWGEIDSLPTDSPGIAFWREVYRLDCEIKGKKLNASMMNNSENIAKWHNKLHTDSAEYKMWGNGIALPNALYVMQGIALAIAEQWR